MRSNTHHASLGPIGHETLHNQVDRDETTRALRFSAYEEAGGLEGAIAKAAERLLERPVSVSTADSMIADGLIGEKIAQIAIEKFFATAPT